MICIGVNKNFLLIHRECLFISIQWYSLSYVFSFFLIKHLSIREVSTPNKQIDLLYTISMFCGVIGARLWHIMCEFIQNGCYNGNLMFIWNGGLAIQGGIFFGYFSAKIFCKIYKIKLNEITDALVKYLPIGLFLGRLGNFCNNEFSYEILPNLPMSIFSSITEGLILGILINIFSYIMKKKDGDNTYAFLGFYGLIRFVNDMFRTEPIFIVGLKFSQIFCMVCIFLSIQYFYYRLKNI